MQSFRLDGLEHERGQGLLGLPVIDERMHVIGRTAQAFLADDAMHASELLKASDATSLRQLVLVDNGAFRRCALERKDGAKRVFGNP